MNTERTKPKILIVDDMPINIKLLVNALIHQYEPVVANRGATALQLAAQEKPDLILLDIMMPEMDGYTVCQTLKAQEETCNIPVIFISAMNDEVDEMKGLQLGAVDYITKPFSVPIVLARIATHLALRNAYLQLEAQCVALQEMERLRKDVEAITRHDLKSPIDGILGCAEMVLKRLPTLSQTNIGMFIQMILDSARQLREMVNLSLNLIKLEQGSYAVTLEPINLLPVIQRILADSATLIETKKLAVSVHVNGHPIKEGERLMALGDEALCYTMIANLFRNAVEASETGQTVQILLSDDAAATVAIHNQGTVPDAIRDRFFDKYVTCGKKGGTGLGTYSAKLMAEAQKGSVHLQSSEASGTVLTVVLLKGEQDAEHFDR
ncbi:MAG: hybrid sensor histidine kinase/response regulator [Magnetococcales bacterium]|nr:hybrid sensor histidine kinase/response regulator [Magnetococcales bacterium]